MLTAADFPLSHDVTAIVEGEWLAKAGHELDLWQDRIAENVVYGLTLAERTSIGRLRADGCRVLTRTLTVERA